MRARESNQVMSHSKLQQRLRLVCSGLRRDGKTYWVVSFSCEPSILNNNSSCSRQEALKFHRHIYDAAEQRWWGRDQSNMHLSLHRIGVIVPAEVTQWEWWDVLVYFSLLLWGEASPFLALHFQMCSVISDAHSELGDYRAVAGFTAARLCRQMFCATPALYRNV